MEPTKFDTTVPISEDRGVRVRVTFALRQLITFSAKDREEANYPMSVAMVDARKLDDVVDAISSGIFEGLEKRGQALKFPASWVISLQDSVIVAFGSLALEGESGGYKLYSVKYRDEDVKEVTFWVSPDHSRLWLTAIGALAVAAISFIAVVSIRRRKAKVKSKSASPPDLGDTGSKPDRDRAVHGSREGQT
jgi:hypothetical protein